MDLEPKSKSSHPWMVIRKEWFLPTKEDWRGNYPNNTVLVRVCEGWHPNRQYVRNLHLTLWGTGDFGMHKWVKADIYNVDRKRRRLIMEVNELPVPLKFKWLKENGFSYC